MLGKSSNESTGIEGSPKQQSTAQLVRRKHRTYWNSLPSRLRVSALTPESSTAVVMVTANCR